MKKLLLLLALSGCVAAGHAQEILLGTDFKMYFDNKEFGSNECFFFNVYVIIF